MTALLLYEIGKPAGARPKLQDSVVIPVSLAWGGNTERGTLDPIVSLRPSGRLFCYMLHGSQANVLYLTESPFGLIK